MFDTLFQIECFDYNRMFGDLSIDCVVHYFQMIYLINALFSNALLLARSLIVHIPIVCLSIECLKIVGGTLYKRSTLRKYVQHSKMVYAF